MPGARGRSGSPRPRQCRDTLGGATTPVEDLLSFLSAVDGLALVASIRGDQRPLGPPWRSFIRVGPLGLEAARDAFLAVAGETFRNDPDLDRLLEAVDRLALAITLLAHEAEGEPNLSGLWRRWQARRTDLLQYAGGEERLTNIEVSLDLSWNGPRMTPEARRLLSVMALLPDGAAHEDLGVLMPGGVDEAVPVLRKVGLAFDQDDRLRVLAPVREYVQRKHGPVVADLERVVGCYLGIALDKALTVARSTGRQKLEANCIQRLGDIALARSDHDAARARYEEALPLYRNVGSVLGEANCIQSLGDIALERSYHDAARAPNLPPNDERCQHAETKRL